VNKLVFDFEVLPESLFRRRRRSTHSLP
jgi:hypothetical protein